MVVLFLFYFLVLNHLIERWILYDFRNSPLGNEVFTIEMMEANLCANDNSKGEDLCDHRYNILDKQYRTTIIK